MLNRRAMLLGSAVALPSLAQAQDVPPPAFIAPAPAAPPMLVPLPQPAGPQPGMPQPGMPQPGVPQPGVPQMGPARPVPQMPPNAGFIERQKTYFLFYDQTIDVPSMRALRRDLTRLVEAGVVDITLVIHSPGGLVDATYALYSFIRALPARITTHATGFVMSAACILFLAGENRSADRNARFMFHPGQAAVAGNFTGQQVRERAAGFDVIASVASEIYHDRTSLSDEEIARFAREEVFYTAEQARAAGIVQTVADLQIPGDQRARILFLD